jgi:hypothetical protein
MAAVKKQSDGTQARIEKMRSEAKKEVAVRGTVQYRLDEQTMLRLMHVADVKKTPFGVLARMWMVERLDKEEQSLAKRAHRSVS